MQEHVVVIGGGLAGSEAALTLSGWGVAVTLVECRPHANQQVHQGALCAELVCSNSLKSSNPTSAAGMLKNELALLGSVVFEHACANQVPAGGALAVDRTLFAEAVTQHIASHPLITRIHGDAVAIQQDGRVSYVQGPADDADDKILHTRQALAVVVATGPLTSKRFEGQLASLCGREHLAFFDAAAPIVMADSLDHNRVFRQSRYDDGEGDYLNAPFDKQEYERFIDELLAAQRTIARDFETKDLFQACQPIEEVARSGRDAPRFGALKPVGLTDPRTGRRPWAAVQLRAEDAYGQSYNLVGFQTNLTFSEQERVFRMIPGFANARFARYGVMHRNTFVDAPRCVDATLRLKTKAARDLGVPIYLAGQVSGTEGYCEAMRSGLHAAIGAYTLIRGLSVVPMPPDTAFGALLAYASDPATQNYQPMHVNFGIVAPLRNPIKNRRQRYEAYADRAQAALAAYRRQLAQAGVPIGDLGEAGDA